MKPVSIRTMFVAGIFSTAIQAAVIDEDFEVTKTANLVNLCTASADDPRYREAIHFCHGYLVGAVHYYRAQETGSPGSKFLCVPEPKPTRNETINRFVTWVQQHPEYKDELPVETEFRFLIEMWPCNQVTQQK
jgi:Rap1a immunity proteins